MDKKWNSHSTRLESRPWISLVIFPCEKEEMTSESLICLEKAALVFFTNTLWQKHRELESQKDTLAL